ncbi:MAG: tetratricopeptide repeat protein [Bacteroidota bacterium]
MIGTKKAYISLLFSVFSLIIVTSCSNLNGNKAFDNIYLKARNSYRSNPDSSRIHLIEALSLASSDSEKGKANYLLGVIFRENNQFQDALSYYLIAKEFYSRTDNDRIIADLNTRIGWIYNHFGMHQEAIHFYELAMAQYFKEKDYTWMGKIHYNLAIAYDAMDRPEAGDHYLKALDFSWEVADYYQLANIHNYFGGYLLKDSLYEGALKSFHFALEHKKDALQKSYVYYNLADTYLRMNNLDSASFYWEECYWIQKDFATEATKNWTNTLLAKLYKAKGLHDDYKTTLEAIIRKSADTDYNKEVKSALYQAWGDYLEADPKLSREIYASIGRMDSMHNKDVEKLKGQYNRHLVKQAENQVAWNRQKEELVAKQRNWAWLLIIPLGTLLFFIWRGNRRKKLAVSDSFDFQ